MTTGSPDKRPKVSIIIPVYNGERYLAKTLQSVTAQTEEDWEVIAVNDGSNDGSLAILEEAVMNDPGRIRVITVSNGGVSRARNTGVGAARGTWIAFLDQDDLWAPRKLELQLAQLRDNNRLGISYTNLSVIDHNDRVIREKVITFTSSRNREYVFSHLVFDCFIGISTVMMKKELFHEIGGFDPQYSLAEDYDFLLKAVRKAPVDYIDEPLLLYREHSGSGTHTKIDFITNESFAILHSWYRRDPWFFRIHFLRYFLFWLKFKILKLKVRQKKEQDSGYRS